jgi:TPR repeat protein
MYANGQGVTQDFARAHMWYNLASSAGDADGAKNRDIIAKIMTPQQIEKAQAMARKCQARSFKGC